MVWPGKLAVSHCGRGWHSGHLPPYIPSPCFQPCTFLRLRPAHEVVMGPWLRLAIVVPCPSALSPAPSSVSSAASVLWLVQGICCRCTLAPFSAAQSLAGGRRQAGVCCRAPAPAPRVPSRPLLACVSRWILHPWGHHPSLPARAAPQPQIISRGRHYFHIPGTWGRDSQSRPCVWRWCGWAPMCCILRDAKNNSEQ